MTEPEPVVPEMLGVASGLRLAILRGAVLAGASWIGFGLASVKARSVPLDIFAGMAGLAGGVVLASLVERAAAQRRLTARGAVLAGAIATSSVPVALAQSVYAKGVMRAGPAEGFEALRSCDPSPIQVTLLAIAAVAFWGVPCALATFDRLRTTAPPPSGSKALAVADELLRRFNPGWLAFYLVYGLALVAERRLGGRERMHAGWIMHITTRAEWERGRAAGRYSTGSLLTEGFIYFCTEPQLDATARRFFEGEEDLVVLVVDPTRLEPGALEWEEAEGQASPRVRRALHPSDVVDVRDLPPP